MTWRSNDSIYICIKKKEENDEKMGERKNWRTNDAR